MEELNEHITKFLKYYIVLPAPEYAILLDGEWGSGKTHFIDKFIKNDKLDKLKFIKISLFGMRETSEIDEELFQQLHPILGHKYVKLATNVAKGAVKFGFRVNLDNDKKDDDSISIDLKNLSIFSDKDNKNKKDLIFVFDDLERTDIEITKVLGYINSLVELSKQKVIILANEKKLIDRDKKEDYKEFKEKVIGKTFEIKQDFDSAYDSFLTLAKNSKELLKENQKVITDVFEIAGYKNLRHIRQSILDFEHLYENIDKKYAKHPQLMRDFIQEFFAYSIEVKHGKLENNSISEEDNKHLESLVNKDEQSDKEDVTIFSKYTFLNYTQIVTVALWDRFFKQGTLEKEFLNISFDKSSYFTDETQEDWVKLRHFRYLENDEFEPLLKKVFDKFEKSEYCEQITLLHVGALLMFFSKEGLYDKSLEDVKKEIQKVIDGCSNSELWKKQKYERNFRNRIDLDFISSYDPKNFQEIEDYLLEKNKEAIKGSLSEIGKEILDILRQQKDDIYEDLSEKLFNHEHKPPLTTLPVFSTIEPKNFLEVILSLKHKEFGYVMDVVKDRYSGTSYHKGINGDLVFWEKFNKLLDGEIEKHKGTVKGYWLKHTKKIIDEKIINSIKHRGNYDDG